MTDKEIIKALECCITECEKFNCKDCCYQNVSGSCYNELNKDAIDLINRQQAENKKLKTENLILSQKRFNIFERIEFTDKLKKQIKSEAIKEFAERLKENYPWKGDYLYSTKRTVANIDNLVKEMVSGDKVQWLKQGECPMTPEQFNAIYDDEMVGK